MITMLQEGVRSNDIIEVSVERCKYVDEVLTNRRAMIGIPSYMLMHFWHSNYYLGDDKDYSPKSYFSEQYIEEFDKIPKNEGTAKTKLERERYLYVPVYGYDHSGLSMSIHPFADRFDSGQLGFVRVDKHEAIRCGDVKRFTVKAVKKVYEQVEDLLDKYMAFRDDNIYDVYIKFLASGNIYTSSYCICAEDVEIDYRNITSEMDLQVLYGRTIECEVMKLLSR